MDIAYQYDLQKMLMEHERNIRKEMRNIFEKEQKNKDRVNISLDEYEKLKNEVDMTSFKLQDRINKLINLIDKIGIPIDILDSIDVDTIRTFYENDYLIGKRRYRIDFYADLKIEENN